MLSLDELSFVGKKDEQSLTIDSDLMPYELRRRTTFGTKFIWLDNGRSNHRVFLQFKRGRKIDIGKER